MTPHTQHHTQSVHTSEQEPSGPGHPTRGAAHHRSNPPPQRTQPTPPCRKETPCQTTKTNHPAKANPAGTKRVGRQGGPTKRDRGARVRRGERSPSPPRRTHTPLPRTGPQPGANRARHGAIRARQREGVSTRLLNSTPGQGARATRRPGRAHTQHRKPARTTAQSTTPPQQTPTPHDEQASKNKSKPCSPQSATAAVQCTHPLPATKQPLSGWTCVRPAVNPAPAGYGTAAIRMELYAPDSGPSPCRLRNSRPLDGRVCTQQ